MISRIGMLLFALLTLSAAGGSHAAQIVIVNQDPAGVGLNDPTPVAPAPGNPGTTLGQQRMNVIVAASTLWGRQLVSQVPIRLETRFTEEECSPEYALFGFAGPKSAHHGFANAPRTNTWYSSAQASAHSGVDHSPGNNQAQMRLNVRLDQQCMGPGTGWWYGLEPAAVPNGRIVLLTVVLHEMAHALGMVNLVNTTGQQMQDRPDAWNWESFDLEQDRLWPAMTNAQRAASMINDPDLVWTGDHANEQVSRYLHRPGRLVIQTPAAIAGNYVARSSAIGQPVPAAGIGGQVVAAVPADGCSALTNAASVAGKIALIDRGTCIFPQKVANANAAGAIAVIVADNAVNPNPMFMGGIHPGARIPSHAVHKATGDAIRAHLASGVTVRLTWDTAAPIDGTREGFVRLHAPNPFVSGSSVSHISTFVWPPPLMAPYISPSNFGELDMTPALLRDIGWPIDPLFGSGFGGRFE